MWWLSSCSIQHFEEYKEKDILIAAFPLQKYLIIIKEGIEMEIEIEICTEGH